METMSGYQYQVSTNEQPSSHTDVLGYLMPARPFFFVIVEEPRNDGFLVRKIYAAPDNLYLHKMDLSPAQQMRELFPERYGLSPKDFESVTSIAEHVMGNNKSAFISTSALFPGGSPRFVGKSIYIDIAKAKRSGATLIDTDEILRALEQYRAQNLHLDKRITKISSYVRDIDKEILVKGKRIPASAVFTDGSLKASMRFAKYARVVQVVGIVFTAYDLGVAADASFQTKRVQPIAKEVIRQTGGWAGGIAGFRIGAAAGALVGVETGPGVLVTGLIGGIVFGAIGYIGTEAVAEQIPN
ncbi:glycine zipper family protein [Caballeronia glathei]|nr:glycine zipper family protein [Caballeronia glathei]